MNSKKKKNRIILCLCSIFVLVASIFSFIPLAKESKQVYADTVTQDYSFSGSNISSKTTFNSGFFKSNNLFNCELEQGSFNTEHGQEISSAIRVRTKDYIFLSAGTYTISSSNVDNVIYVYDSDFNYISNESYVDWSHKYFRTFTLNSNRYVRFAFCFFGNLVITPSDPQHLQLELGSYATSYQPYYTNETYLNYEFDFNSQYDSFLAGHMLFGQYIINDNTDYVMVTNTDYTRIVSNENRYWMNPSTTSETVNGLYEYTFSKYNFDTQVLDNNYIFKLYSMFDNRQYQNGYYFESHVSHVILGSYLDAVTYFTDNYSTSVSNYIFNNKYNFISYVDVHGIRLTFFIPLDSSNTYEYFEQRTYYLSSDAVTNDSYNNGYSTGYTDGYNRGNQIGTDTGYKNGYKVGKNDGYNLGYNTGVENANRYTFTNLISAVIDVPVKAFTSLFNFEILGVNLSGFFLGLLTCCIVIGVIRLIL